METLHGLLQHVRTIVDKDNEIQDTSGDRFNIFGILGVTSSEIDHSAFLAELLNPHGSHGLKDKFLEAFIMHVFGNNFCLDNAKIKVYKEYHIGKVTDTEGGKIDILIREENGKNGVIIENKIYAGDQPAQLIRYDNYGKEKGCKILYLTLRGSDATPQSCGEGDNKVEYTRISYKKHILEWLYDCMALSARRPHVRETISQYISIVRTLTNQDMSVNTNKEILDLIFSTPKNLEIAIKVKNALSFNKKDLLDETFKQLSEITRNLSIHEREENARRIEPAKWKNNTIAFSFESGGLLYGIKRNAPDPKQSKIPEIENIFNQENWKVSEWWPMYAPMYANVDLLWYDLHNGKFKEKAGEFVKTIVERFGEDEAY